MFASSKGNESLFDRLNIFHVGIANLLVILHYLYT